MIREQQIAQRQQIQQRRNELAKQIACGEQSLLVSADDRTRRALDEKLTSMRDELQQLDTQLTVSTQESFPEFHKRHGGEYVLCDGKWLYPDGAMVDPNGMMLHDPLSDTYSKLRASHRYVETKLQAEITAFNSFKSECVAMAQWAKINPSMCCPPPGDAAEQLQRGRERINALRGLLATISLQVGETPEEIAKRRRQESEREHQQQLYAQLQTINAVSIDGYE